MSDAAFPLSVTLKGGRDFDAPWIVVYGHAPDEVQSKLEAIANGGLIEATINAANALKGANNAAPLLPPGDPAAPQQPAQQAPQQSAWGQQPQQQQAPQSGRQQNRYGGELHPEGKQCHCGKVLEKKKTQSGKAKWQCPDWRWNNGNPNDHAQEWIN